MLHSAALEFKIEYAPTKDLKVGDVVRSESFSTGPHTWRISCYPRGDGDDDGDSLSLYLGLVSKSTNVKAIFEAIVMKTDDECTAAQRTVHAYKSGDYLFGWPVFAKRSVIESRYLNTGWLTFICGVIVLQDDVIAVPPSDIGIHLGRLLDGTDGTDVSFQVDGETFHAHRDVLAARSPVFRAELFGSMAEATMPCITLQDVAPAIFKAMLRFMYTDALPAADDLGPSPTETFQHLLAVADRYALDRLKLMCAQKLWENVSVETVATVLACAETYNCSELKKKCLGFFAVEENFKQAVFTEGFALLVQKFPEITADLKKRINKKAEA